MLLWSFRLQNRSGMILEGIAENEEYSGISSNNWQASLVLRESLSHSTIFLSMNEQKHLKALNFHGINSNLVRKSSYLLCFASLAALLARVFGEKVGVWMNQTGQVILIAPLDTHTHTQSLITFRYNTLKLMAESKFRESYDHVIDHKKHTWVSCYNFFASYYKYVCSNIFVSMVINNQVQKLPKKKSPIRWNILVSF